MRWSKTGVKSNKWLETRRGGPPRGGRFGSFESWTAWSLNYWDLALRSRCDGQELKAAAAPEEGETTKEFRQKHNSSGLQINARTEDDDWTVKLRKTFVPVCTFCQNGRISKKQNQDALPPVHPSCHSRPSSTLCFIGGNYPGLLPADQSHANALMLRWSGGTGVLEKDRFVDGDQEAPETHARKGQTCWLLTSASCWGVRRPRFTTQSWNLSGCKGSNLTPITSSR